MLKKLGSRKFIVTLIGLVSALLGLDLELHQHAVVALVAVVYVIVEGTIDRKRAEGLADDIKRGLELGREVSTKGASE